MLWRELGIPFDAVMGMTPAETDAMLEDLRAAHRRERESGDTFVPA